MLRNGWKQIVCVFVTHCSWVQVKIISSIFLCIWVELAEGVQLYIYIYIYYLCYYSYTSRNLAYPKCKIFFKASMVTMKKYFSYRMGRFEPFILYEHKHIFWKASLRDFLRYNILCHIFRIFSGYAWENNDFLWRTHHQEPISLHTSL